MNESKIKEKHLLEIIKKDVVVTDSQQKIVSPSGVAEKEGSWLLDFRNIFLDPIALELIVEIFWDRFEKEYPFQVGGQEIAAIPLVAAIVLHSQKMGKPINGFIIRKSRKPIGLQKIIEGKINSEKIILVDDLTNSGQTFLHQIKILKAVRRKVDSVFVLVSFREKESKDLLTQKDVRFFSLYSLKDLGLSVEKDKTPIQNFDILWHFKSPKPNFFLRVRKSTPVLDEEKIYFGSDNGCLWALNQKDGSVAWKFQGTGYLVKQEKIILSSPAIYKNTIYFGAYDGNVYAVNKETGRLRWKNMDADFVGSSPAVAADLGLLFVGLEFGLFRKKGGIVALNLETGKKVWGYQMKEFVHCSPAYCPEKKVVAIGGNDFYVYLFDAKTGKLKWKYQTGSEIKASLVFDTRRNLLLFGSFDKNIYAMDIDSGKVKGKFQTKEVVYSTPIIYGDNAYFGSMDKHLYSLNLDSGKLNWHTDCGGRIFAQPQIIEGKVYIGSTAGIMYEIDLRTGRPISYFIATERITNEVLYNSKTKRIFLPTYANEIYCLKKKETVDPEKNMTGTSEA